MAEQVQDVIIKVANLGKTFKLPREKHLSLKSAFVNFYRHRRGYELQQALKDVSFEVKKGEFLGIVGKNGSGKSTLLKLIAGIYTPTKGTIKIRGKLTPFIELGVGFNMELTGRENVFLNGALLGFSRKQMRAMYADIVEFAELGKFMDQKLKNYSSGMQVRLAFSIAIRAQSDILLFDEVLAVGDAAFQQKCLNVFRDLKKQSRTIVLVTHDMANVERFCDRVLVLDEGRALELTTPQKAASVYARLNVQERPIVGSKPAKKPANRWGTGGIQVRKVSISQSGAGGKKVFEVGKNLQVNIEIDRSRRYAKTPIVCGLAFHNQDSLNITGPNSLKQAIAPSATKISFSIDKLSLAAGEYRLTVAIYDEEVIEAYDFLDKWLTFSVVSDHVVHGLFELPGGRWHSE